MPNPEYLPYRRGKKRWPRVLLISLVILALTGLLLYQIPSIHRRASWRLDMAMTYIRMVLNPVKDLPTPVRQDAVDNRPTT